MMSSTPITENTTGYEYMTYRARKPHIIMIRELTNISVIFLIISPVSPCVKNNGDACHYM